MPYSNQTGTVESITIVHGKALSALERAKYNIGEDDFAEIRVVKNSPKKVEVIKINKAVKPTSGFREAIKNTGLLDHTFN